MLTLNEPQFREAVQRSKGRVVVLVHPFFEAPKGEYRSVINRLKSKVKWPVVVLEEDFNIDRTHNRLGVVKPFYVATHESSPAPKVGWGKLRRALSEGGVKHILIGGMYSRVSRISGGDRTIDHYLSIADYEGKQVGEPIVSHGCISHAYRHLLNGPFEKVRLIPNLVYPDKPPRKVRERK